MARKQHHCPPQRVRRPKTINARTALQVAIQLHQGGRLEEAYLLYQRILQVEPANPDALNFLGVLLHQRGRSVEAVKLIERAIVSQSDYVDAHNNLGNILVHLGQFAQAVTCYRKAITLRADYPEAHRNLGVALRLQGELEDAIQTARQAVALGPDDADAYFSLGQALDEAGQREEAILVFREGLRHNPKSSMGYRRLGRILYLLDRGEEARECYHEWTRQDPDSSEARHMLAAFTGENVPARAADDYVRSMFDRFADSFDQQLQRLGYRAPTLLADALAAQLGTPGSIYAVLDAGCGTGWCGPLLRPYARYLTGVDLSPVMLDKARARGAYDELVAAELTTFLRERPDCFDLIVSADTLVYFGELGSVLTAAAGALRTGGWLAFTLEQWVDDAAEGNYRLNYHGRYSHKKDYLRQELAAAGLTLHALGIANLRFERGEAVTGYVVLAVKQEVTVGGLSGAIGAEEGWGNQA